MATLGRAADPATEAATADDYRFWSDVSAAMGVVTEHAMTEAEPNLRAIELSEDVGSSGGWIDSGDQIPAGRINPFNYAELTRRARAQITLRRLGLTPADLPPIRFFIEESDEYAPVPQLDAPRAERVELVEPGMDPEQILAAIGHPDRLNFREVAWEYDIDGDEPYTLRVRVHRVTRRVVGVERVEAMWRDPSVWP